MGRIHLMAAFLLLAGMAFALTCDYNGEPWLDSTMAVNCDGDIARGECYIYVSETTSATGVEFIPESAFNTYGETIWANPAGDFAASWRLSPSRYLEGSNYTFDVFCANSTATDNMTTGNTFVVQNYAPPQWLASFGVFLGQYATYIVGALAVGGVLLIGLRLFNIF